MRIPLVKGRLLTAADSREAPRVTVISEPLARRWWPNESPIGKRFKLGDDKSKEPWMTIVGVVAGVAHNMQDKNPRQALYAPFTQSNALWMDVRGHSHRGRPVAACAVGERGDPLGRSRNCRLPAWLRSTAGSTNRASG